MDLVVISGKGGTGKTTMASAFSELAKKPVRVDCDVDAPNLHMFYEGQDIYRKDFFGGKKAVINYDKCIKCGICEKICKFDAIKNIKIDDLICEGCGACVITCPSQAITLFDEKTADVFIKEVRNGILSRSQMEVGSDGSGKLVTSLRKEAKAFQNKDTITIIDASPGIGCSVIASITDAKNAIIITEPTKSGLSDLKRILELCEHFELYVMVCINKYDINEEMTLEIENFVKSKSINIVGKVPFDDIVMKSVNELKPITEYKDSNACQAIENMWYNIEKNITIQEEKYGRRTKIL